MTSPALDVALSYHHAWTGKDFEKAMTYVADDIVCHTPGGPLSGAGAFRGFMGPFTEILTGSTLLSAFGDETTALLMYDTATLPVASAPGAELLTVREGKIVELRIVFDRAPFDAAREAATKPAQESLIDQ